LLSWNYTSYKGLFLYSHQGPCLMTCHS